MEKEIRCNSNGCNCTKEERATNNGNCKHSIIVYMENKQPIGADCVCDLGSEKHYHPQCEYLMENKDWREQYPLTTFTGETRKEIESLIESVLKSKQEEIEKTIDEMKQDPLDAPTFEEGVRISIKNLVLDDLKPIISNILK